MVVGIREKLLQFKLITSHLLLYIFTDNFFLLAVNLISKEQVMEFRLWDWSPEKIGNQIIGFPVGKVGKNLQKASNIILSRR
ncbi:MAG: hypothetical protein EAX90_12775 [Candidatus Heimdallarchaeota archaeon]|nr:hypothetical protein [Candidatus Heimdallarchaeota archaeon]